MGLLVQCSSSRSLYWMHIAVHIPACQVVTRQLSDTSMFVYTTQVSNSVTLAMAMHGVIEVLPKTQLSLIALQIP